MGSINRIAMVKKWEADKQNSDKKYMCKGCLKGKKKIN